MNTKLYLDGANIDCDLYGQGTALDLLNVDTTGNSSANRKYLFETDDASKYINSPVTSGYFIGKREVIFMYPKRLLVIITEFHPVPGRIWYNHYNYGEWSGWRSDLLDLYNHKSSSDHDDRYYTEPEIDTKFRSITQTVTKYGGAQLACDGEYGYPATISIPSYIRATRNIDGTYDIHISALIDGPNSSFAGNNEMDVFTTLPIKRVIGCNDIVWEPRQTSVEITGFRNFDTYKNLMTSPNDYLGRRGLMLMLSNPQHSSFALCRNYGLHDDIGAWGHTNAELYSFIYYEMHIYGAIVS